MELAPFRNMKEISAKQNSMEKRIGELEKLENLAPELVHIRTKIEGIEKKLAPTIVDLSIDIKPELPAEEDVLLEATESRTTIKPLTDQEKLSMEDPKEFFRFLETKKRASSKKKAEKTDGRKKNQKK